MIFYPHIKLATGNPELSTYEQRVPKYLISKLVAA